MTTSTREGTQFSAFETFEIITCYKCGIPFGVPRHWKAKRREDRASFWCPNGHQQAYTTSTATRLERQLKQAEKKLERELQRAHEQQQKLLKARKSHRRMRDRVRNGVCPCCNRTFQNLLRHMQTEHPDEGNATLKQIRELYGMTQADLAEELGVYAQHISLFENSRTVTAWASDQIEAWLYEQTDAD